MELGKAKTFGIVYEHHRSFANIYSDLDDRRGYENLVGAVFEVGHDLVFLCRFHLAMDHAHSDI